MTISHELIDQFNQRISTEEVQTLAQSSVMKNGLEAACLNSVTATKQLNLFSHVVKGGDITNQKQSGRCWMFASLNTMRVNVMKNLNLDTFEFSEVYPFFWDKFEKSNYFFDSIIETVNEDTDSRLIQHLLQAPVQDGGQWDMFKGLLQKYGAVPKYLMPETFHSSSSGALNQLLTTKLREGAMVLRQLAQDGATHDALLEEKKSRLYTIYRLLTLTLGTPPVHFNFEYTDKNGQYHLINDMTPQRFFNETVGWDLNNMISLINAPTNDKPYQRAYTVKYLGSVKEADPICYINVPVDVLKEAAIAQLKDGLPVWFGCDVGKSHQKEHGIMDVNAYHYDTLLEAEFLMNKGDRLNYGESLLTHAMTFVGVNLDENEKPTRWKVENSWGVERNTHKGYYIMSDEWFNEYNYQIMCDIKYVPSKWLKALDEPVIELEPWDPMGSLAKVL